MCKAFSCFQCLTTTKKTKKSQIVLCQIVIRSATLGLYIQNRFLENITFFVD